MLEKKKRSRAGYHLSLLINLTFEVLKFIKINREVKFGHRFEKQKNKDHLNLWNMTETKTFS